MKKIQPFHLYTLFFFLSSFNSFSQSTNILFENSFTEQTSQQQQFLIYLDSIDKYLYRDVNITIQALEECEVIIQQGTPLSESSLFQYNILKIYSEHSNSNPLAAYQLILDSEFLLESNKITKKQIKNFNYMKSYTYMAIGDLETAQRSYYQMIEEEKANRDTANMVNSLYSLGQLYTDQNNFDSAIKYLSQINEFSKTIKIRPSTLALTNFELSEAYIGLKAYGKALETIDKTLDYLEGQQLDVLKSDLLLLKGNIYLNQNKIDSAQYVYEQLEFLDQSTKDQHNLYYNRMYLAKLYTAKQMYPEALAIYEDMVTYADTSDLKTQIDFMHSLSFLVYLY